MHYLLDKTKIENNLTLFFLKRYAARKLKISPRDQQHPSLSQMVLSVNHWSLSNKSQVNKNNSAGTA